MRAAHYFVYILANRPGGVLYTGVTNDLKRRVFEHKSGEGGGFTMRYNVDRLVYYEVLDGSLTAITREKQIKAGPRRRKIELIEGVNPEWMDLYDEL
jgi:putative endonuclease